MKYVFIFIIVILVGCSEISRPSSPIITPNPSPAKLKPYPCKTDLNNNCNRAV